VNQVGTGKTSLVRQYVHKTFSNNYKSTIGVDFALKLIRWDDQTQVRLQLWDIAGQERFGNMTRVYYKEAVGAIVVYDVNRAPTFEAVKKWKNDIDNKVTLKDQPIPTILLANKCDLLKDPVNKDELKAFCTENEFKGWFETSARSGLNVEKAVNFLVAEILVNDKANQEREANSGGGNTVKVGVAGQVSQILRGHVYCMAIGGVPLHNA